MPFVQRLPFVTAGTYFCHDVNFPEWDEAYFRDGTTIFEHVLGYDFFISANGPLRCGRTLQHCFPDYAIHWDFPINLTESELAAAERYRERWPAGYIVAHLSDCGMFQQWVRAWGVNGCAQMVKEVERLTGLPVILTGGHWDAPFSRQVASATRCADLSGRTSLDEFFALFRGAAGAIGWCGGNTILATTFRTPTLIAWSTYFPDARFYRNACPPDAFGKWYEIAVVEHDRPDQVARRFAALMERNRS
jgi:hypothetical protein